MAFRFLTSRPGSSIGGIARAAAVLVMLALLSVVSTYAQPVRIGVFIQTIGEASADPEAETIGFSIEDARLSVEGQPEPWLGYELESNFAGGFELKDALINYRPLPALSLTAGHFKPPFSRGALVSSSRTPFVDRPRVSSILRPGRRVGLQLRAEAPIEGTTLRAGLFNGDDSLPDAPERGLLYAGRIEWQSPADQDLPTTFGANVLHGFDGAQTGFRYGVDGHMYWRRLLLSAEVLATQDRNTVVESGRYLTAGYAVADAHLVLARWDHLDRDVSPYGTDLLALGYVFDPENPARFEVNYLVPAAPWALDRSSLLVNLQLSL